MANNTKEATIECLEKLHFTTCPSCPSSPKEFKDKFCPTCTRTIGYEELLKDVSDVPWAF